MRLIAIAAALEAITGMVLIADPSFLSWLLFGTAMPPAGIAVGRVAGFALLALAVACRPPNRGATRGLLAYNVLAAVFFIYLGIARELVGILLWPAAAVHALLSVLLARLALSSRSDL